MIMYGPELMCIPCDISALLAKPKCIMYQTRTHKGGRDREGGIGREIELERGCL